MSDIEKKAREWWPGIGVNSLSITKGEPDMVAPMAYLAGASEAMRWRDPVTEPPTEKELVLIAVIESTFELAYLSDRKWFDAGDDEFVCHIGGAVWRPIGPLPQRPNAQEGEK